MSDLRKLAASVLARKDGTADGTAVEHVEQGSVFHSTDSVPGRVEQGFPQKCANNAACSTVPLSRGGTSGTWPRLVAIPCPFDCDPKAWRLVVKDGVSLIDGGWADMAVGLGWSALDLFGAAVVDAGSDGLAVWSQGRRLRALCGTWAVALDANGSPFYFNRSRADGAVLLWELGRRGR